jgi:Tfp pilus assembly protein FimT
VNAAGKKGLMVMDSRGISLVELMAGLVVFGILIAATLPAFRKYMTTQQVEGAANRVAASLRLARQKATAEGNVYVVAFDPVGKKFIILDDDNNNGVADAGEMVDGPFAIPAELTLTNGPGTPFPGNRVVFFPNGTAGSTGELTISNAQGFSRLLSVMRSTGAVAAR